MIKLIMMMTDLVIFILVDVQANEQTLTSFHSSLLRSPLPLPSKLDDVQGPFYLCLESFITGCSKDQKQKRYLYLVCIAGAYPKCFRNHKDYEDDPLYKKAMEGYENCVKKHKSIIHQGECLRLWFNKHIKEHWHIIIPKIQEQTPILDLINNFYMSVYLLLYE